MSRINSSATALFGNTIVRPVGQLAPAARLATAAPIPSASDTASFSQIAPAGIQLAQIGAALDVHAQVSNTLATADTALDQISGLLGHVQSTLADSTASDSGAHQASIDKTLASVDQLAASTKFAGRRLLDGSYSVTSTTGTTLKIPSFTTTNLGVGDQKLSSLATGGANAIAVDNPDTSAAAEIVAGAINEVNKTRSQLDTYHATSIAPIVHAGLATAEAVATVRPAIDSLSIAKTAALLVRAQTLIDPSATTSGAYANATNAFSLLYR